MEAQTTQQNPLPRINDIALDFKVMSTHSEVTIGESESRLEEDTNEESMRCLHSAHWLQRSAPPHVCDS